jgi:hypothetical protein
MDVEFVPWGTLAVEIDQETAHKALWSRYLLLTRGTCWGSFSMTTPMIPSWEQVCLHEQLQQLPMGRNLC